MKYDKKVKIFEEWTMEDGIENSVGKYVISKSPSKQGTLLCLCLIN